MEYALLQAVFLPLLLSPVAYLLGKHYGPNVATWFSFGLLLYCTILVVMVALPGTYEEHYFWTELFGEFGFLLRWTGLSICNNYLRSFNHSGSLLKTIYGSQIQRKLRRN